ncbi:MAG: tetratricopeptide repeat protein [Thermoguttaceae bacterium]|nr:tetratricopeptide repeat protein [Thermoguttaceae bacterium]MDW8077488.1 tetratricopeptide repeat protein [Thermoguttaceae bacterium]
MASSANFGWGEALALSAGPVEPTFRGLFEPSNLCPVLWQQEKAAQASAAQAEEEWDRVEALAHYSAARKFEHEGELELALRWYQRAVRYDPQSEAAFQSAVRVALRLGRLEEAARLIRAYGKPGVLELTQILPVGLFLIQRGNYADAAEILELTLADTKLPSNRLAMLAIRMELGRLYFLTGDYEKSAGHFAEVVTALREDAPEPLTAEQRKSLLRQPVTAWRLMGSSFLLANQIDRAEECFRQAFAAGGTQALLGFDLARVFKARGAWAAAESALSDYLKDPREEDGLEPYRVLTTILENLGRRQELLSKLSEAQRARPDNVPLAFALAEEYFRQGMLEEAAKLGEEVLEKRPTIEGWQLLLRVYQQGHDWQKLLDLLGRMQQEGVTLENLEADLRKILIQPEVRKQLLDTLISVPPSDEKKLNAQKAALASLAIAAKEFPTARTLVDQLINSGSEHCLEVLLELAFAYGDSKDYEAGCELINAALARSRDAAQKAVLSYYLAGFLELSGKTEEAISVAKQAIEASRENPRFQLRLGWILLHAKRNEEAAKAYRELLERWESDHSSSEVRQVVREAKLALSHLAALQERFDEAVEWLEQVLDEFPNDPSACNDLGYLWADQNVRLHRALRMIQKAVEAEPDNAAYRDSLGWVLFRLGRYEEALGELQKASAADPDPVILDHLGEAYKVVGQLDKAAEAWQKALERFLEQDNPKEADKIRKKLAEIGTQVPAPAPAKE